MTRRVAYDTGERPPAQTWPRTLLAFAADIEGRTFLDWLRAHTSFLTPLHRYRGELELDDARLAFAGRDRRGPAFDLTIPLTAIGDVRHGFDDRYRRSEDRQIGLFGFEPLRVRWSDGRGDRQVIYLFARFHHAWFGARLCDNAELLAQLAEAGVTIAGDGDT